MILLEELGDSLRPFCDPATDFRTHVSDGLAKISMVRFGEERAYVVDLDTGAVEKRPAKQRFLNIDSLLASAEFADLRYMADTQRRVLKEVGEKPFLSPRLSLHDEEAGLPALEQALKTSDQKQLRVVLVDGPAGVGKTYLLARLAWQRADAYVRGEISPPVLHVTSRGRRLSNLKDALSTSIAQLRGKFTFEQVPLLVRRGLLVLAIDGFDELVDAEGYHDAWFALRSSLDEIGKGGLCILAGRDTFFDQQGFRERLERESQSLELILAHLQPVNPPTAKRWLVEQGWSETEVDAPLADEVLRPGSYTLRPYFLKELSELRSWAALEEKTARGFLLSRFLDREANIIHGMVRIEKSQAHAALVQLFENTALNMAEEETDTIDLPYLALLCEIAFESTLNADDLKKLKHKVGSTGLLESDARDSGQRRFPHSEIQHHFLAHALLRMETKDQVTRILRRAVLGADFLEVFLEVCEEFERERVALFAEFVRGLLEHEISMDRLPQNGGALLVLMIAGGFVIEHQTVQDLALSELVLIGTVAGIKLRRVTIGQLKTQSADLSSAIFDECHIDTLVVDEATRFGTSLPEVNALHISSSQGSTTTLRARADVQDWLSAHSLNASDKPESFDDMQLPLMKLFERICRRALRVFYIREGDDDPGGALLANPLWSELDKILTAERRLERSTPPMHGPASDLIRIKNPRALLEPPPDDEPARRIRAAVLARARELG